MSAQWLGVKKVRLDTIVLPGGFAKRKKEPHVALLAASIERGGVISLPVIDAKSRKLVAGGDRLAALQLLKVAQHEVRLVEGTPEELEAITIEENLHRRRGDDYDAMTARLVQLQRVAAADEELEADSTGNPEPARRGRPQTDLGAAREVVAERLGKTPEAIRQAEKRAKAKEEEASAPAQEQGPPVTTYGVPMPADLTQVIREAQVLVDEADRHLRAAQRSLAVLGKQGSLGGPLEFRMRSALHTAADTVRRERPDSICPCCKLLQPQQLTCAFCGGIGVVSNMKLQTVAPDLLLGGDKAMVLDGRGGFMPYAKAKAAPTGAVADEDDGMPF